MSDDSERGEAPDPTPHRPAIRTVWAWEGPDAGPDDADAVRDLSAIPDVAVPTFRWRAAESPPT